MQAPDFWYKPNSDWRERAFGPLSLGWRLGTAMRRSLSKSLPLPGPCFCVGNAVAGGSGKTPVVQYLARLLHQAGKKPGIVLSGYGGKLKGPLKVDLAAHNSAQVGDEALLHAVLLPTYVARDRVKGAELAFRQGCQSVLFDDGFQNPALGFSNMLLVIDGETGIGNGKIIPAGPLREPLADAISRANAVLILDEDKQDLARLIPKTIPVFRAKRSLLVTPELYFKPIFAFAGIAHPTSFFAALARKGLQLAGTAPFSDHHLFKQSELNALFKKAEEKGAQLVTTGKDWIRLSSENRMKCTVVGLDLEFTPNDMHNLQNWIMSAQKISAAPEG